MGSAFSVHQRESAPAAFVALRPSALDILVALGHPVLRDIGASVPGTGSELVR